MARLNSSMLYGAVADVPRVIKDDATGEYKRAAFHIAVVKDDRNTGLDDKSEIQINYPLIVTQDPEQVRLISKLKMNDIVELEGMFVTRKVQKLSHCKFCGHQNVVEGNFCYVRPIAMKKRNTTDNTEKQAIQMVIDNKAFSNKLLMLGNVCSEVKFHKGEKYDSCVYQVGSDRKFFIKEDDPDTRSDFPIINTYGAQARKDTLALKKSSLIYIDGYLRSKEFSRKTICSSEACKKEYQWKDNVMDIIAYDVQYCSNYDDPEEKKKQLEQQKAEERAKTTEEFFGTKRPAAQPQE